MTRRVLLLALVVALMWLSAPGQATGNAPFIFQTDMYGRDQVPPVDSIAWGFVRFFFSEDRLEADYTVDVKGLSGTLVEGADIHRGAPGTNGPIVHHLADGGFIVTAGKLRLSPEEVSEMLSGAWYVSLKTKSYPDGELRGQVLAPAGFNPAPLPAPEPEPRPRAPQPPPIDGPMIRPPNTGGAGLRQELRLTAATKVASASAQQ